MFDRLLDYDKPLNKATKKTKTKTTVKKPQAPKVATNAMMMSEIPIVTIGKGLVASCGVLTLMAGDRRLVTHNTSVMSHQFSWGSQGKEHELKAIVKEFDMAGTRMIDHYKKCTKKSETYIRKNLLNPTDAWLSPEDCVKHGIIDEVVTTY